MKTVFPAKVSMESLFAWLISRIADEFEDHAILKGGMSLRLLDCPRSTNDIDYTFVPYSSKKEIVPGLEKILREIPNSKIERSMSSKSVNFSVSVGDVKVQVEGNVSPSCKSIAMSTNSLARPVGQLGRIVRIMSLDVALSHKLAAWNERRLLRDLYDAYFIYRVIGEKPDKETLLLRLAKVESRIPKFKMIKRMDLGSFIDEFDKYVSEIDDAMVKRELAPLLAKEEIAGLSIKLRSSLNSLSGLLRTWL